MSLKNLVLATQNPGKVKELAEPLTRAGYAVQTPPPDFPEVEETGTTFAENALLKARTLAHATGLPALADDSGLEVDALHGSPGVYSARYGDDLPLQAGESRDARNIRKLLHELAATPAPRTGRFCCCMAAVFPDGSRPDIVVHGYWDGEITLAPKGDNGFGYDPVFLDPATGLTAAELSREQKMARSHRAKALALMERELAK